jgi:hypothetical protein
MIEEIGSIATERGLCTGILNRRGGTIRNPEEGGKQERELAAGYDQQAMAIADEWPRTAAVLRSVAGRYRSDALRHDDDAERARNDIIG